MTKTVFVVGAGASAEFDLPVGKRLAQIISRDYRFQIDGSGNYLSGSRRAFQVADAIINDVGRDNVGADVASASEKLFNGVALAWSIDNYLHAHSQNEFRLRFGKYLIAESIASAEKSSKLYFDTSNALSRFDFSNTSETWLHALFSILATAGGLDLFERKLSKISFICFNYDRIIERFFFLAMQSFFDMSEDDAANFCSNSLDIFHPYGVISKIDYSNHASGFGEMRDHQKYVKGSSDLQTFTERTNAATQSFAKSRISEAENIFFLGFSYLSLNMDLLSPRTECAYRNIIGTRRGVSDYNLSIARRRVESWGPGLGHGWERLVEFHGKNCNDLIHDYTGLIMEA